ncbi:MAG TPA: response regulator transcription factor [Candidatus Dormibacteraeota bacterium]|nr:response regulator transcription factor [Candidatus Dormibacteraeota bacterium]
MASPVARADARTRVLVADAEPARVGALVLALGEAGCEADTAYRVATALARVAEEPPDLVIVGDRLEDLPAVELIARLVARSAIPVLAVFSRSDERSIVALLDAGADDVISGVPRPLELVARVRSLLRRSAAVADPASDPLPDGLSLDIGRHEAAVFGRPLTLTPIEFELLAILSARRGDVVGHRSLLRAAWPERPEADPDLLRTHLTHLNAKLVALGHPGLRNVRGTGYALRVEGAVGTGER